MNGRPKWERAAFGLFLLLVASLAFQKPALLDLAGNGLTATDLIFPIVLAASIGSLFLSGRKLKWRPVYFLFAVYIAAFVIASIFADDLSTALIKTAATLYLLLIAVLTVEFAGTLDRIRTIILTFLAASAVPVLLGLFSIALFYLIPSSGVLPYLTYHYGAVPVGNYPRLSSTFASASMFCNYLNMLLMLLLIARSENWIGKRQAVIGSAAIAVCAMFTISSGLGAVVLALGFWTWFQRSRTNIGRLALATGVAASVLFLATGIFALQGHATAPYKFQIPVVNIEAYPSPRLLVWSEAANNFLNNFFTGTGPGTHSAAVTFQNTDGSFSLLTDAHNTFLNVGTQTGIIGLAAMLGMVIYLLMVGFRRMKSSLQFGLAAAFLTAFVVQGSMGSFEDARHLWLLVGLLVAAVRLENKKLPAELGSGT